MKTAPMVTWTCDICERKDTSVERAIPHEWETYTFKKRSNIFFQTYYEINICGRCTYKKDLKKGIMDTLVSKLRG